MNTFRRILIGSIALGATLSAYAGPDWALIEKARKEKQAATAARHGEATELVGAVQCPPEPPVLLLDHGPRAQTTPYVNEQRRQRHEAQVKACEGMKK